MSFVRIGLLALVSAAATLSTTGAARADEPAVNALPHGISLGSDGRYYQDLCDHSLAYHCLARRRLPETYHPVPVAPVPLAGPFAGGGGNECSCTVNPCGGGGPSAPTGAMEPKDVLAAYKVPASSSAGGKIVAIIDLPDANALKDVNVYRKVYGIPALPACPGNGLPDPAGGTPCFATVDENGSATSSAGDCQGADGETGIVVDPDDFDSLVVAVASLLADPPGRRAMGEAARRRCAERFSLDVVASAWRDALVPLLARR